MLLRRYHADPEPVVAEESDHVDQEPAGDQEKHDPKQLVKAARQAKEK